MDAESICRTEGRGACEVCEDPVVLLQAAQDVGGLDIAVRIARSMQCAHRPQHLAQQLHATAHASHPMQRIASVDKFWQPHNMKTKKRKVT